MDDIKVKIRSANKRSLQRIERHQLLDLPTKHKIFPFDERFRIRQPKLEVDKCSGITLQDYIRGDSPSSPSPESQIVKIGIKEVRLNFPKQPRIQEIDQDNYDQAVKQTQERSLPKIFQFSNPISHNLKTRSPTRVQSHNKHHSCIRQQRIKTVYGQPFFNHKPTISKKHTRQNLFSSSLNHSIKAQSFIKLKQQSPYLATSIGFIRGVSKKRSKKNQKSVTK